MSEICTLISMGFPKEVAQDALTQCNGDVEVAIEYLLSPTIPPSSFSTDQNHQSQSVTTPRDVNFSPHEVISTSLLSQYDFPNGKSACTSIALAAVQILLPKIQAFQQDRDTSKLLKPDLIDQCLFQGIEKYETSQRNHAETTTIEHTSPEEVIPFYLDTIEWINNSVTQGVLTDPQQLTDQLKSFQHSTEYRAVVMTKPPETIVLFVAPSSNDEHDDKNPFFIFDSHKRPNVNGGAHIKQCMTLKDLIMVLSQIFPTVDLGEEGLNIMYNSFDLYLLNCLNSKK